MQGKKSHFENVVLMKRILSKAFTFLPIEFDGLFHHQRNDFMGYEESFEESIRDESHLVDHHRVE